MVTLVRSRVSVQGNYTFDDEPVSALYPHFPVMPYGEYRNRFLVSDPVTGVPCACSCVDSVIMPKI